MELTAANVSEVVRDCLYTHEECVEGEPPNAVKAAGVVLKFGFNPDRLEKHREDVVSMLQQLPSNFLKSGGQGWTFLNMCLNANDEQWTGMHSTCDELVCLALALKLGEFCMPRVMWNIFPGSVPYLVFDVPLPTPKEARN